MFPAVGYMPMPAGFAHADIFLHGRPRPGLAGKVQTYDAFYRKHPPMDVVHRAKIFAPFDALRGFSEAIAAKVGQYEEKKVLTEGEKEELEAQRAKGNYRLSRKICFLSNIRQQRSYPRDQEVSERR